MRFTGKLSTVSPQNPRISNHFDSLGNRGVRRVSEPLKLSTFPQVSLVQGACMWNHLAWCQRHDRPVPNRGVHTAAALKNTISMVEQR